MTRDECVAEIKRQLGFRTTLDTTIVTQLQIVQTELELAPTLPWFLVSEDSYSVTTPDEQRIVLPTDFLQEIDEATLRYVPDVVSAETPEKDLIKDDYDELRKSFMDTTTGTLQTGPPEAYAIFGNYFRIFPTPDDIYTLKMIYYAQDDTLDTNIENQWLKYSPQLLMGKAGKMIAGALRDSVALGIFQQWEAAGQAALILRDASRPVANRNLQVGGRH